MLLQRLRVGDDGQETKKNKQTEEKKQVRQRGRRTKGTRINLLDYAWANYKGLRGGVDDSKTSKRNNHVPSQKKSAKIPRTSSPRPQGRGKKRQRGCRGESEKVERTSFRLLTQERPSWACGGGGGSNRLSLPSSDRLPKNCTIGAVGTSNFFVQAATIGVRCPSSEARVKR